MCTDCLNDYFRCPVKGNCLPPNVVCDGHDDCGDGADERDCGAYFHALFCSRSISYLPNLCMATSGTPSLWPISCQVVARGLHKATTWQMTGRCPEPISLTADAHFAARLAAFFYWTRFFENNVPFDNTTPINLINLIWKLGLGFRLKSELQHFSIRWSALSLDAAHPASRSLISFFSSITFEDVQNVHYNLIFVAETRVYIKPSSDIRQRTFAIRISK